MTLKAPMLRFCEQVAIGVSASRAYMATHPNASYQTACSAVGRILRRPDVAAEILRLRVQAQQAAGSAVLTLIEKRSFLARVVRAQIALLPRDSDLWQSVHHSSHGTFYRLPDKIEAITIDNDLSGDGAEANANDSLTQLLTSLRK